MFSSTGFQLFIQDFVVMPPFQEATVKTWSDRYIVPVLGKGHLSIQTGDAPFFIFSVMKLDGNVFINKPSF